MKMIVASSLQQLVLLLELLLLAAAAASAGQKQVMAASTGAAAFIPHHATIGVLCRRHTTTTTTNTRLYDYDTEEPDPSVVAADAPPPTVVLVEIQQKQPLVVQENPPPPETATTEAEAAKTAATEDAVENNEDHAAHHSIPVKKIRFGKNDKELWFAQEAGKFYEANDDSTKQKQQLPLATILERTVDTVEDAILHARRAPYEKGWIPYPAIKNNDPNSRSAKQHIPTVVVLGSGWASHALMKVADTVNKMRLIVISPVNHFVFTPMLASSAVGTVEYRSMTEATRAANPMIEQYIEGKAIDVDVERRVLKVQVQDLMQDTRGPVGGGTNSSNGGDDSSSNVDSSLVEISYDKLVVAVGCKVLDTIVPGADRYTYKLKTCDDARLLRTAVGECLEYACRPHVAPISNLDETQAHRRRALRRKRLTWVIVGGGPTGVELAGELSDFVADITKPRVGSYHKLHGEVQIVLVQGAPFLVPQFEEPLRHHALATLSRQGVDVRLDTLVQEVGDGWIKLQRKDDGSGIEKVETLDFGLCVWAAGIAPVPFVDTLLSKLPEQAKGPNGRVNVDKWLRCPTETSASFGSILVMGDAAAFIESSSSSQNATGTVFLPQTAQVAAQMGAYVARMLDRGYNLSQTPPVLVYHDETENDDDFALAWLKIRGLQEAPGFQFLNLGMLAYLGQGNALSQFQLGDVPIFSYVGSVAFMLWRSVYLVKQVATRNRILVLFDWAKCKIFGRDITRL